MRGSRSVDSEREQDAVSRRRFLTVVGAGATLTGLAACTRGPRRHIVPYVVQPPEERPGVARHYATAMSIDGYGMGLVVEAHEGRPTKIEGNPEHPASLGATGVLQQAAILNLYNPSRARALLHGRNVSRWEAFLAAMGTPPPAGKELHFLMEPTSSMVTAELIARVRRRHPGAYFHYYTPFSRVEAWEGARLAFGRAVDTVVDLRAAKVIVSLGADFLACNRSDVSLARRFADGRRVRAPSDTMNRLYVIEPALTVTGTTADHRLRVKPSGTQGVAGSLLSFVQGGKGVGSPHDDWLAIVAKDLVANRGACVVMAGDEQPPPYTPWCTR